MPEPPIRLRVEQSLLLAVDLQEKLVPVMADQKTLVRRVSRLMRAAEALGVPTLVTEQYPKGLGRTLPKLMKVLGEDVPIHEKLKFSGCVEPVAEAIESSGRSTVVVVGIEAHVCVLLTCLDLLERGYRVALPLDGTASRRGIDRDAAFRRLLAAGVVPTTVEAVMFEWVGTAQGDAFRAIRDIVKEAS